MLKKLFALFFAMSLILSCVAACNNSENKAPEGNNTAENGTSDTSDQKVLKIGCEVPLTGGSAEQGNRTLMGATLAVEEINAAGGINGYMLELVAEDDEAQPQKSATIANKFVADEDIVAVVGYTQSSCALAAAPIYNQSGLVQVCTFSSNMGIAEAGPYTFRTCVTDALNVDLNLDILLNDKGLTKLGMLYENNDFGVGFATLSAEYLENLGMSFLVTEQMILGETKDFSTIITKFKDAGVEGICVAGDETELCLFAKQCHQLGYFPEITSPGTYNPNVIELGGEDVEGLTGNTLFDPNNLSDELTAYFENLFERFPETNGTTDLHSTTGYTAVKVVAEAIEKGGTTREEIKDYMTTMKDFPSFFGPITFDENGDAALVLSKVVIKDGTFVSYTGE